MKVHLMYKNRDFDNQLKMTGHHKALIQDLELNTLFDVMADNDNLIFDVARTALFSGIDNKEEILYRQNVIKDCIKNPDIVRKLYNIATEAIERRREYWWGVGSDLPTIVLGSSIRLLQMLVGMLEKLRKTVDGHAASFKSDGFIAFVRMLQEELDDEYISTIRTYLNELNFPNGILVSARLGNNNQGINYVLRSQHNKMHQWLNWTFTPGIYINDKDENGLRDLSNREDRAVNNTANVLAQSAEHILSFFTMLRTELAFYVGCLNLYNKITSKGEPVCFPQPEDFVERKHSFKGLYDICLSLIVDKKTVGNDINADGRSLVIITGANQGGKSTFLRSIGQAQLMMQCGMFVGAENFCANICRNVFTHYKREEDISMKSGKLDEELERMSNIADQICSNSMVLFNESFAATNEREGSEIARQVVCALLEKHIKVYFVTHLYEFANDFYKQKRDDTIFLRAERQSDGHRTYKINEGEPLQTSYGEDLYNKIFNVK